MLCPLPCPLLCSHAQLLTEAAQLQDKWADSVAVLTYIESVMRAHYGLAHPDSISITTNILRTSIIRHCY